MRYPTTVVLSAALTLAPLAGCASASLAPPPATTGEIRVAAAGADAVESKLGVTRVLVSTAGGTHLAWRIQGDDRPVLTELLTNDSRTDELASGLALLAADMLIAGARAWLVYAATHPGKEFDREACVRAIVAAMVAQAVSTIPVVGGVLSGLLLPIVFAWIARSGKWPWQVRMRGLLEIGAHLHAAIVKALAGADARPRPVPAS
ncbi:MAG: hypothetical protein VKO64_03175 [Candidatus Sericytochromatia bacterium]|nr:hypothetical protein [Candidatus Sericytochromatia bacterium]